MEAFLRTLSNYQAHAVGMCYLSWSCMWFSFMIRTIHVSMLIRIIPNKYIFLCTNIDQWHNQTHLRLQAHFASYLIFVMRLCLLLDSWSTYPVCFWPFEWSRKMPGHRIETLSSSRMSRKTGPAIWSLCRWVNLWPGQLSNEFVHIHGIVNSDCDRCNATNKYPEQIYRIWCERFVEALYT